MEAARMVDRRYVLSAGAGLLVSLPVATADAPEANGIDPEEGVTAPEDLMKEHGVLNRCLLIYEEGLRRLAGAAELPSTTFWQTARLIRSFVEGYHERNEEQFIFPEFRRADTLVDLVDTLYAQHRAGRRLTEDIIALSEPAAFGVAANRDRLAAACRAFVRMYRPHAAREDTVLFRALRGILPPKQVLDLGDWMEEVEEDVLGEAGFERSAGEVRAIEMMLGIHDLDQFSPRT